MLLAKHLIILSVLGSTIRAWPMVRIHYLNVTHDLLLTHYGGMNTSLSTTGALNVYFHFAKDVNIFVKIVVNFNYNNLNVNFMNKTVSWCKIMQAPRYEPLIKIVYKILSQRSHLPQKCPMEKNHLYYIPNFTFETDKLPPILPDTTNVTFNVEFLDQSKHDLFKIGTMNIIGQAKTKHS